MTELLWTRKEGKISVVPSPSGTHGVGRKLDRGPIGETSLQKMNNTSQYAVGWFTLSLINAGLAQTKGRSGLGWWFGSLFFGPICTLLIVVLDPVETRK